MRISEILDVLSSAVLAYPLPAEHQQTSADALHLSELMGGDGVTDQIDPGAHLAVDVFRPTAAQAPRRGSLDDPPELASQVDLVLSYSVRWDQQRADLRRAYDLMDALTVYLYDLDLSAEMPDAELVEMLRVSDVVQMPGRDDPYMVLASTFTVQHPGRAA